MGGEAKSKLSFNRDSAAIYTRKLFFYTNYTLFMAAFASVVVILLIKASPTGWGWVLLTIDVLTVVSGIAGCVSCSQPGCYTCHIVMTAVTAILQGILSLVLFTKPGGSLQHLKKPSSSDEGAGLVKLKAGLSLLIFCVQWIALGLSCIIHYCMFNEFYLEGKKRNRARVGEEPSEAPAHVVCDVKAEKTENQTGNDDDAAKKKKVEDSQEFVSVDLS
ncbi:hypothetical protein SUGI_0491920 [Cryptomeria japonica]|uniref:uncharacterized protein LOC131039670 n=1 Tax=Cryptomeria japonica TaxID=3369 RepID=UPI002408BB65|nr:uncharacterized protein LOC131039670 [Cryptomeria japonica]GLJ25674.1 hypothetical protein SUGI_0491920 [Cryptomeria japonica]